MFPTFRHIAALLIATAALAGCALVDENVRDCETDYTMDYQLRLVTNMTTELRTQLNLAADLSVSTALETYLSGVFTDRANDVDLSFYDVTGDSLRLHNEKHIMNASQTSYTLYIPVRKYMHVGLANLEGNKTLSLEADEKCHTARLHQQVRDTLPPHKQGVYTSRLLMDVKEGLDQRFDVRLYMANCASALVLDTLGCKVKDIQVYATGFATDFDIADSLYRFQYTPVFRTDKLKLAEASPSQIGFVTVSFPSRDVPSSKVVINSDDPFVSEDATKALWQFRIYSTLADGKITETQLSLRQPLRPGQLKVLKAKVYPDGSLIPGDPSVGVSITLDWTPGLEHEVIF